MDKLSHIIAEAGHWKPMQAGQSAEWNQGRVTAKVHDSALWKAVVRSWPKLEENRCWSVGNGSNINFWSDKWINDSLRIIDTGSNVPVDTLEWKVQDVVSENGEMGKIYGRQLVSCCGFGVTRMFMMLNWLLQLNHG
ncbi:putative ribonuclease H protein [Trifolium medium]|uniref:Putative ribonuclease H protein n=1 Tax=Trifolium medium TaxID=97028 RepID=A0A392QXI9_9FABA|nr:putative ribonuclease H protein [Trifolium medium]